MTWGDTAKVVDASKEEEEEEAVVALLAKSELDSDDEPLESLA